MIDVQLLSSETNAKSMDESYEDKDMDITTVKKVNNQFALVTDFIVTVQPIIDRLNSAMEGPEIPKPTSIFHLPEERK